MPGGYVEAKETDVYATCDDNSIPEDCHLRQWESNCIKACSLIGQTLTAPENVKKWMIEAGFVDVKEEQFKLPINPWPKDPELKLAGRYQQVQYSDALQPYALGLLVEVLGWSREEMELFLVGLRKDLANRALHGYNIVSVSLSPLYSFRPSLTFVIAVSSPAENQEWERESSQIQSSLLSPVIPSFVINSIFAAVFSLPPPFGSHLYTLLFLDFRLSATIFLVSARA